MIHLAVSVFSFAVNSVLDGSFYFGVALGVVGHVSIKALVAKAQKFLASKV